MLHARYIFLQARAGGMHMIDVKLTRVDRVDEGDSDRSCATHHSFLVTGPWKKLTGVVMNFRVVHRPSKRVVHYIKKDENDVWKSGTIISDRSIRAASFTEDVDVRRKEE